MTFFEDQIEALKEKGIFRSLKRVSSGQGPLIRIDGKSLLNFCSNNYLGLANDPRLIRAGVVALRRYGAGSGAARLISGNFPLHEELESRLAGFKGTEAALLFNSGYHANIGIIPALAAGGDLILSDEFNHASLIDGCRLSKAKRVLYRHNDLNHLEDLLKQNRTRKGQGGLKKILIVTEAVFSMEGDLCPLEGLLRIADRYGAMVYLDEAHAVGLFGKRGEGLAPRRPPPHLVLMGTLGKAFGSYGAFVAGSNVLKKYLINRARSFIFTTALPPAAVGASLAALKIIQTEPERRKRFWRNVDLLRRSLNDGHSVPSPIFSIVIGSVSMTMDLSRRLFQKGIFLQGIRPPTVPEGTSRLRLTVMATHTERQIFRLVRGLQWILKK